ncbi:MAG: hypothetical protein ACHQU1_05945 [Gemmatimonadales bacterium]
MIDRDAMAGRLLTGGMLLALLAVGSSRAGAQGILGRVRDRARQAVTGNQTPQTCAPSDYNRAVQSDIGEDVVTRYTRALAARNAEIQRTAGTNTPEGRYFAAMLRRDSLASRHAAFRRHVGPDWARYQAIQSRPPSTDYNVNVRNALEGAQVEQGIDENRVEMPTLDWNTQQSANVRIDNAAYQAGNFDVCGWAVAVDVIPQVVGGICQDRSEGKADRGATEFIIGRQSGLRTGELRAIHAHALELARGLNLDCPSDEELAAMRRERAQQDSTRNAVAAWQACQQRNAGAAMNAQSMGVNPDSMRIWQQQLEDAQKRGDQSTIMAIGMKMGMAMAPGMQQRAAAQQQASQQCGPMPGTPTGAPK